MQTQFTTPMIRQYLEIKERHRDAILFFRLGDFYEMFFEDAKVASKALNIALTSRNKGKEDSVPLCGVPYHAAQSYIDELILQGHKVAICEQVEDPKLAQDIVKREVIQIVTPGLITDGDTLSAKDNNFLLSIAKDGTKWGVSYLDISTGEFNATQVGGLRGLEDEITRIKPKEVLIPDDLEPINRTLVENILEDSGCKCINRIEKWVFDDSEKLILGQYKIGTIEGLGLDDKRAAVHACGAIIHYANLTQKASLGHISRPKFYSVDDFMILDSSTVKNLEIVEGAGDFKGDSSLLSVLDKTITPMGGRKIREWLLFPLLSKEKITERHEAVEEIIGKREKIQAFKEILKEFHDLERLSSKVSMARANARDLASLRDSIELVPKVKSELSGFRSGLIKKTLADIDELTDLKELIGRSIGDSPPLSLKEGGFIREGFNKELDELRKIRKEGKTYIASLEAQEKKRTGIGSLKIGYNQVFGYYIEVTKANLVNVPAEYIRKQTLSNAERFITPELKEYEDKVLNAEERIGELEYKIFVEIRNDVAKEAARLNRTSQGLAVLDLLFNLAYVAQEFNYTRPKISDSFEIIIEEGRHPVIERLTREPFIPNDLKVNTKEDQLLVITGPNMAGKSTILRQAALIAVMAQVGSFVPASKAEIGIVDKIFTRVGARDRLTSGFSTFMVEMMETSNILHNATERSLIVLDEIGRGTSTFDGVSIAWAVAEFIHDKIGARTLFATHYHELCDLAKVKERVKNYNVAVKEWEGKVIFLRKLSKGPVNRSYGIQVAKLAGLPDSVIERAREILVNLESGEYDSVDMPKIAYRRTGKTERETNQMKLFREFDGEISKELNGIDINTLTPIEALTLLQRWKDKLK
jgi:DNA mismatch repair protein MutS